MSDNYAIFSTIIPIAIILCANILIFLLILFNHSNLLKKREKYLHTAEKYEKGAKREFVFILTCFCNTGKNSYSEMWLRVEKVVVNCFFNFLRLNMALRISCLHSRLWRLGVRSIRVRLDILPPQLDSRRSHFHCLHINLATATPNS